MNSGSITDAHLFPFSVFSAFKHGSKKAIEVGEVAEVMDKTIGRLTYKVKGAVSANNFVQFNDLNLSGHILHLQMCLIKPNIATIHIEVETVSNVSYRFSLSTLYDNDQPRFLGRSLRYI